MEILADREWMRQVVESLVDNALRHATGLSRVTVALAAVETRQGPVARSRSPTTAPASGRRRPPCSSASGAVPAPAETGFGIGLALARWIVEQHDGAIRLGAGADGGARG